MRLEPTFVGSSRIWGPCPVRAAQIVKDRGAPVLVGASPSWPQAVKDWGDPVLVHLELVEDWGVNLGTIGGRPTMVFKLTKSTRVQLGDDSSATSQECARRLCSSSRTCFPTPTEVRGAACGFRI